MVLKVDKERKKAEKADNAERAAKAAEQEAEREQFRESCRARADELRGLIGALVCYQDSGSRYGYLYDVAESGLNAQVERIMPLGCKSKPEIIVVPCARIEAKDYTVQGKERKVWPGRKEVATRTPYEINTAIQTEAASAPVSPDAVMQIHDETIVQAPKPPASEFAAKAVELFKANPGIKISELAVLLGYPKGSGNNRTRGALKAAGLL